LIGYKLLEWNENLIISIPSPFSSVLCPSIQTNIIYNLGLGKSHPNNLGKKHHRYT
jgi:hypothetical protein